MSDDAKEEKYQEEAERLAKLFPKERAAFITWLRSIADDRRVRKVEREAARERADALEALLQAREKRRQKS
jgi:hypothetical protein